MLQRCALAASPAVVLCSAPRGGVASAAPLQKRRSRAAVYSAERPLLFGVAARWHARGWRLLDAPPSWTQHPWYASPLLQRCRATAIKSMASDEEAADDCDVLVAEQQPSMTALAPRGALTAYCRLLRSQPLEMRDGAIVVPVSGKQLFVLAAWLNRDSDALQYDNVEEACAVAKALDIPLLLQNVDAWLAAQEASSEDGGGVLGEFNCESINTPHHFSPDTRVTPDNAMQWFDWAVQLAQDYRLPRFSSALCGSLEEDWLPDENARELLLHVMRRKLLEDAE